MRIYKERLNRLILPTIALVFLVSISVGLFVYRRSLQTDLQRANCDTLNHVMEQQRFSFSEKLMDQKNALKICAKFFEETTDTDTGNLLAKLSVIQKNSTFDFVTYATSDGDALENTGLRFNVRDRDYFCRALAGETIIADPIVSKTTGRNIIPFATPIFRNGQASAVLIAIYNADSLSDLLIPSFSGKGCTYVTTGSGEIIFKTEVNGKLALYSNLFDAMETAKFYGLEHEQDIRFSASQGLLGHSRYRQDGEVRLMHYAPLGINDWYMFAIAPDRSINPQSAGIMYNTALFMFAIATLSVGALSYIFFVQRQHMKELRQLAFVDTLTGSANRKRFKLTAGEFLADPRRQYAFIILDIDKFKVLNDTFGYACGDTLLIDIAHILSCQVQEKELFGRYDADEFYLLLAYADDSSLRTRLQRIITQIETNFKVNVSSSYNLVLCIGVYVITIPQESINSISDKARHAHRLIKGKDESGISFYNEAMRSLILKEKEIENKMHDALSNQAFLLYLQPKYYLETEKIYGAEALVRWNDGTVDLVYPNDFIPIFERNGFITKLDLYMLKKACQTIRSWIDAGISPIPISINFSRLHLKNPDFVNDIAAIVDSYRVPPELIEVELTESTMLHNEDVLIDMLSHLHEHGFTLSMDDFGSGYSSLGLLKNLPVDVIKLDRTFFVDCCEIQRAVTVVAGIIEMAKNLGIKTVAEGVETKDQIVFLKGLGCDIVQGYYFAKPMPVTALNLLLNREIVGNSAENGSLE